MPNKKSFVKLAKKRQRSNRKFQARYPDLSLSELTAPIWPREKEAEKDKGQSQTPPPEWDTK